MSRTLIRIGLVVVLIVQAWCAVRLTRYDQLNLAGERSWNKWDAESALISFGEALELSSVDASVWRRNGDMALYIHDYPDQVQEQHDPAAMLDRAWSGYVGAVLRCPVDSWSWTGIAEVALNRAALRERQQGLDLASLDRRSRGILGPDRAMALSAARVAVELKPAGFQELDTLAAVYDAIGDRERAEEIYIASARMVPVPSFHVWGTGRRLGRQLYAAILGGLVEGIDVAPDFERSMLFRDVARFARNQGDYETAVSQSRKAAAEARDSFETYAAHWEMARALERLGRYEEAVAAVKVARDNIPDPNNLSRKLGTLELLIGRVEEACVNLRAALRREPDDAGLRVQASNACEKAGEIELAGRILQEGFAVPTEDVSLAQALLEFHRRQGNKTLALHLAERWVDEFPEREEFRMWLEGIQVAVP